MTRCSLYITWLPLYVPKYINPFPGFAHTLSPRSSPPLSPPTESILSQGKTVEMVTAPTQARNLTPSDDDTDT